MRTISIATASAVALISFSAFAQTPAAPTPGGPAAHPAAAARAPTPNPLKQTDVSQIIGTPVYGGDGNKIGDVSTVLMQPDNKTIDELVVRAGGVLGIGGRRVAMPLDQFSWDSQNGAFKIAKTAKDLDAMAEWQAPGSTGTATGSSQGPAQPPTGSGR